MLEESHVILCLLVNTRRVEPVVHQFSVGPLIPETMGLPGGWSRALCALGSV